MKTPFTKSQISANSFARKQNKPIIFQRINGQIIDTRDPYAFEAAKSSLRPQLPITDIAELIAASVKAAIAEQSDKIYSQQELDEALTAQRIEIMNLIRDLN